MFLRVPAVLRVFFGVGLGLCLAAATADVTAEPPGQVKPSPAVDAKRDKPSKAVSADEARARAKLLHTTYEATLIAVHRAYFDEGKRKSVPAKVMEGVFWWVDQETGGKTRWISVNTEPMNIDHKPESEIEKKAAKALAAGKEEFELIDGGVYHRAGAVTLVASCLRCHEPSLTRQRSRRRVAALVISIPVREDEQAVELPPAPQ